MKITVFDNPTVILPPLLLRRSHANIRIYVIFLETNWIVGLHFASDSMCLSSFKFFGRLCKTSAEVRFNCSRSSMVIFRYQLKPVCDFLLVRPSNLVISCTVSEILPVLCLWPHPYSILILWVFPLNQIAHVRVSASRNVKLISREIIFDVFQTVWK